MEKRHESRPAGNEVVSAIQEIANAYGVPQADIDTAFWRIIPVSAPLLQAIRLECAHYPDDGLTSHLDAIGFEVASCLRRLSVSGPDIYDGEHAKFATLAVAVQQARSTGNYAGPCKNYLQGLREGAEVLRVIESPDLDTAQAVRMLHTFDGDTLRGCADFLGEVRRWHDRLYGPFSGTSAEQFESVVSSLVEEFQSRTGGRAAESAAVTDFPSPFNPSDKGATQSKAGRTGGSSPQARSTDTPRGRTP